MDPMNSENPETLHQCMTKATTAEGDDIRHSLNWVTSRRAMLKITPDALICGDWTLPYSEFDEAVLFTAKQWLIIPVHILKVKTGGKIYQFGLNPGKYWKGELPFSAVREKTHIAYSPYSLAVRVLLLVAVVYTLWREFRGE
jgi:hypothetical protein